MSIERTAEYTVNSLGGLNLYREYDHFCPLINNGEDRSPNMYLSSCLAKQKCRDQPDCYGGCHHSGKLKALPTSKRKGSYNKDHKEMVKLGLKWLKRNNCGESHNMIAKATGHSKSKVTKYISIAKLYLKARNENN